MQNIFEQRTLGTEEAAQAEKLAGMEPKDGMVCLFVIPALRRVEQEAPWGWLASQLTRTVLG